MSRQVKIECKTQFNSKEEREQFKTWLIKESGENCSNFQEYYLTKPQHTFFLMWVTTIILD